MSNLDEVARDAFKRWLDNLHDGPSWLTVDTFTAGYKAAIADLRLTNDSVERLRRALHLADRIERVKRQ